jgi:hypothetical protein
LGIAVFLVPIDTVRTEKLAPLVTALAILLSPEPIGLAVLGACTIWIGILRALNVGDFDVWESSPAWVAGLMMAFGFTALALSAIRPRLGPRAPSKAPMVLGCFLGLGVAVAILPFLFGLVLSRAAPLAYLHRDVAYMLPPEETVLSVGLMVVLLFARRGWVRMLAVVPAAFIVASLAGAAATPSARLPVDPLLVDPPPTAFKGDDDAAKNSPGSLRFSNR